ncbi:Acetoin:2,6-dichlorophenolindophenol oxidoreductase subunit alpha [Candidatus Xiphinematobacter sp. Idaho Grape]|uniref:thiamine pyrophosphate-dependent dehydrogenase E1 component subunit alpha n=1 Tax=Candidatus Xiphinematobacter sp. Idaho Grape TaxID=1704307 RepID=UPI0007060517|nr:thiamine pyrophosphate-dependent dehydrogenase E1 component subunit alpha [Candidatus Xiphinematobacter sp. Idaho Grape]ALJ56888.1 Acetoin:2,6-dichlorophenolindophenol oxidoreductase subunit alpha [Candidatus Xiphinematobacter sp. Idaho Grape]
MPASPETELQKITAQGQYIQAYRFMLVARLLEEKLASLYRAGLIKGGVFLGRGQEAFSVSLGLHLRRGDIYAPLIRDQAGRMAFGDTILDTLRTYLGSQLGSMRGRDGNIHRGSPRQGCYAMISHLGAMISVVVGGLMAKRLRGETDIVGGSCLGEGGTSTGAFHEGINVAAVERVPLVLLVANNQYAYSTPVSRQFACKNLLDKAVGYGLRGHEVDGTNLEECLRVVGEAVRVAREGGGPQLVVGTLLRLVGHGEHDDANYVDPVHYQAAYGRDCMHLAERTLIERSWLSQAELMEWRREISLEVELLSAKVLREPVPDPSEEDWSAISNVELRDSYSDR